MYKVSAITVSGPTIQGLKEKYPDFVFVSYERVNAHMWVAIMRSDNMVIDKELREKVRSEAGYNNETGNDLL